jgi:hypothetical protein
MIETTVIAMPRIATTTLGIEPSVCCTSLALQREKREAKSLPPCDDSR